MNTPSATALIRRDTAAWRAQVWISFAVSTAITAIGIWLLPVDAWTRAFMAMGLLFSVGSALSLAKTIRDVHEASRLTARIDEARFHRLITEHDPLSPPA